MYVYKQEELFHWERSAEFWYLAIFLDPLCISACFLKAELWQALDTCKWNEKAIWVLRTNWRNTILRYSFLVCHGILWLWRLFLDNKRKQGTLALQNICGISTSPTTGILTAINRSVSGTGLGVPTVTRLSPLVCYQNIMWLRVQDNFSFSWHKILIETI